MKKDYVVDTNALLDNTEIITILRNGEENNVFIPYTVLRELDELKKDRKVGHVARKAIIAIKENYNNVTIIKPDAESEHRFMEESADFRILQEMQTLKDSNPDINPILVTNDVCLQVQSNVFGLESQPFLQSMPFVSESEKYTGFTTITSETDLETLPRNSFFIENGKLNFYFDNNIREITYNNTPWNITPRTIYQNAALEVMLNDNIPLVTVQSQAGYGKTHLALASAFKMVLEGKEKKRYSKLYIFKSNYEIGAGLGFLPGGLDEKMGPYMRPIIDLMQKLHNSRPANKLFISDDKKMPLMMSNLNISKVELLPINYIRGMNISDAVVIVDEIQNLDRTDVRSLLTRMGENVKCICLGDTNQIDHPFLSPSNNGLNWIVKKFKGDPNYAHVVLSGSKSRGPICDMVIKHKL